MSEIAEALDAHETAKPGEPTFTLQGGDPLASVLVRLWAIMARIQAGRLSKASALEMESAAYNIASKNKVTTERELNDLLKRATLAEEVSWDMEAYCKGQSGADEPETLGEKSLTVEDKLDIYDLRRRGTAYCRSVVGELTELHDALEAKGYGSDAMEHADQLNALINIRQARRLLLEVATTLNKGLGK
jgi:hypothetical protein